MNKVTVEEDNSKLASDQCVEVFSDQDLRPCWSRASAPNWCHLMKTEDASLVTRMNRKVCHPDPARSCKDWCIQRWQWSVCLPFLGQRREGWHESPPHHSRHGAGQLKFNDKYIIQSKFLWTWMARQGTRVLSRLLLGSSAASMDSKTFPLRQCPRTWS